MALGVRTSFEGSAHETSLSSYRIPWNRRDGENATLGRDYGR